MQHSNSDLMAALQKVLEMANSHIEDIDSGIEEVLYLAADNQDLEDKREAVKTVEKLVQDGGEIPLFKLLHSGKNDGGYTVEATRTGDKGIYEEVRVSVFDNTNDCCADILVTLEDKGMGAPKILITADGNGEGDHQILIRPMKPAVEAVEIMDN